MKDLLLVNNSKISMPRSFLKASVIKIEKELARKKKKLPKAPLTIVFLDPKPARQINLEFRKKDYATDVLSFSNEIGLGELIICPQVILRQAKEHKLSFRRELQYMVLHGILHLLGFDHEKSQKGAQAMFKLQDEIFERLD
jgi:probable rRNA maturation factor